MRVKRHESLLIERVFLSLIGKTKIIGVEIYPPDKLLIVFRYYQVVGGFIRYLNSPI